MTSSTPPRPTDIARDLVTALTAAGERIAVAESLTGGLVLAALTAIPGASAVVAGGVVVYDIAMKQAVLGVDQALLARVGAVDPEVAVQMAAGVRALAANALGPSHPVTFGLATTGVAGPTAQDGHAPGRVCIAVVDDHTAVARVFDWSGTRDDIRAQSVVAALKLVQEHRSGVAR